MPNRIARIGTPSARVQRLRKQYKRQTGNDDYVYLAKVNGSFEAPRLGYYWVHKPTGSDSNDNTLYGAPFQIPVDGLANFPYRSNIKLELVTKRDGITYIRGASGLELINMGYDPRQFNIGNPRSKDVLLAHIINLQAYDFDDSVSVKVRGSIYRKADGTYAILQTQDVDIVTGNTPSSGNQVVVCLWLDEGSNTISTTVSSTEDINTDFTQASNISTALTLINECAGTAPAQAIGLTSWLLYDDGTYKKFHDLRGIIGRGMNSAFPLDVTRAVVVADNTQQTVSDYTISTGGSVVIEGRLNVI